MIFKKAEAEAKKLRSKSESRSRSGNTRSTRLIATLPILVVSVLMLQLLLPQMALAKQSFFDERYRGWLWFEEKEKLSDEQVKQEEEGAAPSREKMLEAKRENEAFAEELELLRHLAIRYPENLEYTHLFKLKEKEMLDNAAKFGQSWLMVNFLHPEIVDELANPQNLYGRTIYKDEQRRQDQENISSVAKRVELFVFRKDGCPYCHTLESHLQEFAKRYGFEVEAVSPDNSKSQYFKTHSSPEMISALGLEVMPTVIAVVNDTRQRFELARGAVSISELEKKSLLLFERLRQQQVNVGGK